MNSRRENLQGTITPASNRIVDKRRSRSSNTSKTDAMRQRADDIRRRFAESQDVRQKMRPFRRSNSSAAAAATASVDSSVSSSSFLESANATNVDSSSNTIVQQDARVVAESLQAMEHVLMQMKKRQGNDRQKLS